MEINWNELMSTVVSIARGTREILPPSQSVNDDNDNGGWLSGLREQFPWLKDVQLYLQGIGERMKGWISAKLKGLLSWTLTGIWGGITTGLQYAWNFNINISDEELDGQLKSLQVALASQFGSFLGCGFGWATGMAAGVGVHYGASAVAASLGIPILKFEKSAMMRGLKDASDEGLDELGGLLGGLVDSFIWYAARSYQAFLFKNGRRAIKWLANTSLGDALPSGLKTKIDNWGKTGSEPWSYAIMVENAVDAIPSQTVRAFVDSFLEESWECFVEAGYVYLGSIDRDIAERSDMREAILGTQQVIEITPDREAPNETIVIAGREQTVRATVMTALATHQMVNNRDVGQYVGSPVNEQMAQQAPTSTLTLRIIYYPVPTPPFTKESMLARDLGSRWVTTDIKIPFIDPSDLTWQKIKFAAGLHGRNKGKVRCYGYLAGRKLEVFGQSEYVAEQWLKEVSELSEAKRTLTGIGFSRRQRNPASSNNLDELHPVVRVFPAYAIILSQKLSVDRMNGRPTLQGNFTEQSQRIELWTETEPSYCNEILQEMKRYHTPLEQLGIGFRTP